MFTISRMSRWAKINATLAFTACAVFTPYAAQAADLTVIVNNVQQDVGQVMLGLFSSAEGFPKTFSQGTLAPAKERNATGQVRLVFKGLAPGQYAATAFMGLPTEPYGFSNNARGNFGPPAFKDAAVKVGEQDLTIEISVK
jgi:uncharacterized protein (DUF2141 family)